MDGGSGELRQYSLSIDRDTFVELLRERADVRVLEGRPTRCPAGAPVDFVAWLDGARIVITEDVPGGQLSLWPPALELCFDAHDETTDLQIRSRLSLGTLGDGAAQGMQAAGSASVFFLGLFGGGITVVLITTFIVGAIAGLLTLTGLDGVGAVAMPVWGVSLVVGFTLLARRLWGAKLLQPVAKAHEAHDERLRELAGELIMPFVRGGDPGTYRRPPALASSKDASRPRA